MTKHKKLVLLWSILTMIYYKYENEICKMKYFDQLNGAGPPMLCCCAPLGDSTLLRYYRSHLMSPCFTPHGCCLA